MGLTRFKLVKGWNWDDARLRGACRQRRCTVVCLGPGVAESTPRRCEISASRTGWERDARTGTARTSGSSHPWWNTQEILTISHRCLLYHEKRPLHWSYNNTVMYVKCILNFFKCIETSPSWIPADNAAGRCYSSVCQHTLINGDQEPFRNQTPLFNFGCVAPWLKWLSQWLPSFDAMDANDQPHRLMSLKSISSQHQSSSLSCISWLWTHLWILYAFMLA